MITCRELAEHLLDFLSDSLPPATCQCVHDHLDHCPPCVVYLETYRLTMSLSQRLPAHTPPAALLERLHAALH